MVVQINLVGWMKAVAVGTAPVDGMSNVQAFDFAKLFFDNMDLAQVGVKGTPLGFHQGLKSFGAAAMICKYTRLLQEGKKAEAHAYANQKGASMKNLLTPYARNLSVAIQAGRIVLV
ncbi:MAG: hypothetical protein KJ922_01285 [Nanoarchaeota archaeon]|nr:hypothetical protein [Nanoarchaeota archaeon]